MVRSAIEFRKYRGISTLFPINRRGAILVSLCWLLLSSLLPVLAQAPTVPETLLDQAREYFKKQQYRQAKIVLQYDFDDDKLQAESEYYLGRIAYDESRLEDARTHLSNAIELNPQESFSLFWLARTYFRIGLQGNVFQKTVYGRKGKQLLDKALKLDPQNPYIRHDLIQYYMHVPAFLGGSKAKALSHAADLKIANPWEGFKAYGTIYLLDEDFQSAEAEFLSAIEAYPDEIQFHLSLSDVYSKQEDYHKAFNILENADKAIPDARADILYRQGMIYIKEMNYRAAFHHFEELITVAPDMLNVLYQLGYSAVRMGNDFRKGEAYLKRYLEQYQPKFGEPSHADAHCELGQLYAKLERPQSALRHFRAALEIDPDKAAATDFMRNYRP